MQQSEIDDELAATGRARALSIRGRAATTIDGVVAEYVAVLAEEDAH